MIEVFRQLLHSYVLILNLIIQPGHSFAHVTTDEQLSCHDMCKIVTWLDQYISNESNTNFTSKFHIMSLKTVFDTWDQQQPM